MMIFITQCQRRQFPEPLSYQRQSLHCTSINPRSVRKFQDFELRETQLTADEPASLGGRATETFQLSEQQHYYNYY